ncbi:hypothetical protein BSF40_39250 [Pseudomonas sp. ACN5]|nr:hypothetical protein BSF40_39250 [Pseudomonas sp. ACN5]
METGAKTLQQPGLQTQVAVPDHAFEERIDECDNQRGCTQLRDKPGALGDSSGNDRGNRRGKGQQEKKLHQSITMVGIEHGRRLHEGHAIRNPIAYKEVGQCRYGEVAEDFRQGIDLVFLSHGSDFEKGKTGVHGQNHDRTDQNEQRVGAMDQGVHGALQIFHGMGRPYGRKKAPKQFAMAAHAPSCGFEASGD